MSPIGANSVMTGTLFDPFGNDGCEAGIMHVMYIDCLAATPVRCTPLPGCKHVEKEFDRLHLHHLADAK